MSNITTHLYKSQEVWLKAAEALIEHLKKLGKEGKTIALFLSGGTATKLYPKIAEYIKSGKFSGALAQVDERFQPENTESINAHDIEKTGLWKACRGKGVEYFQVPQSGTLSEAREKYNQTVSDLFKKYQYKMAILGIGPDGHSGGLLPRYEKVWNIDKLVAGYENVGLYPKRISLTPKALGEIDLAFIVAAGEAKKEAVKSVLDRVNARRIDKYPGALIQKMKRVELYTDVK